jgi:hypothetical protein
VVSTPLAAYQCPSDGGQQRLTDTSGVYSIGFSSGASDLKGVKTNYDFSANGNTYECNSWSREPTTVRRMFGENSATSFELMRDGSSNTFALIETLVNTYNGKTSAWGFRGWVMVGVDPASRGINRWYWAPGYPPDPPTGPGAVSGTLGGWAHAGSMHPGGCLAVMGDGSVQFLQEGTDTIVLDRLGAMADGQVVSLPR